MNCKHGIMEECCHFCNGNWEKEEMERSKYKIQTVASKRESWEKRKELQAESLINAEKHKEKYTDEELLEVVVNTADVEKKDYNTLFNIATKLKRSLGAIEWIWNIAWDNKFDDYDSSGEDNILKERVENIKIGLGLYENSMV